ncbi:MAG: DUF3187 family protein, partial [Dokdonella sp.]
APAGRFALRVILAIVAGTSLMGQPARADDAASPPWQLYRDTNPFVSASGLPFAPPAVATDRWRVDIVLDASNTELAFDRRSESLLYDAEIHAERIAISRGIGEHAIVRATFGGEQFGSGFLDGFIGDFHRTFGFDNGDRGRLGTDGHTIVYADANARGVLLDRNLSAAAPLLLDAAWRSSGDGHEWLYGATLKVPISHASPLVDDRAADLSLWAAAQSTDAQARIPWGARVGVMQRGDTQLLPQRANDQVPFADALIGYRLLPSWDVAAQYQWHGALYDSNIPLLQSAGNLTLSSAWHAQAGWTVRAGLVEDLPSRHAQDVTFFVSLTL